MIQLSEDHSDISVIGVGAHRACYIHPNDLMWGTKNGPLGLVEKGLSSSTF